MVATDQGRPRSKTCTTTVQFTLGTDQPPIFYLNNLRTDTYSWGISEGAFQAASTFNSVTARDADIQVCGVQWPSLLCFGPSGYFVFIIKYALKGWPAYK